MAWEISHSPEVWDDLRETIRMMFKADAEEASDYFAMALAYTEEPPFDWDFEMGDFHTEKYKEYIGCSTELIEWYVIERIKKTNTTDNGGHLFWIDRDGWYKIAPARHE